MSRSAQRRFEWTSASLCPRFERCALIVPRIGECHGRRHQEGLRAVIARALAGVVEPGADRAGGARTRLAVIGLITGVAVYPRRPQGLWNRGIECARHVLRS